jgi:hypothetical protein
VLNLKLTIKTRILFAADGPFNFLNALRSTRGVLAKQASLITGPKQLFLTIENLDFNGIFVDTATDHVGVRMHSQNCRSRCVELLTTPVSVGAILHGEIL